MPYFGSLAPVPLYSADLAVVVEFRDLLWLIDQTHSREIMEASQMPWFVMASLIIRNRNKYDNPAQMLSDAEEITQKVDMFIRDEILHVIYRVMNLMLTRINSLIPRNYGEEWVAYAKRGSDSGVVFLRVGYGDVIRPEAISA